jgi:hypothetical protein
MAFAGKRWIDASEVDGLEPGEQRQLSAYISMAPLTARTREALLASAKPTWRQTARHSPYAVLIRTCGQPRHQSCPLETARSQISASARREADRLIDLLGPSAYEEARRRKRDARDLETMRYWARVKSEIGRRIVFEGGLSESDAICRPILASFDRLDAEKRNASGPEQVEVTKIESSRVRLRR